MRYAHIMPTTEFGIYSLLVWYEEEATGKSFIFVGTQLNRVALIHVGQFVFCGVVAENLVHIIILIWCCAICNFSHFPIR